MKRRHSHPGDARELLNTQRPRIVELQPLDDRRDALVLSNAGLSRVGLWYDSPNGHIGDANGMETGENFSMTDAFDVGNTACERTTDEPTSPADRSAGIRQRWLVNQGATNQPNALLKEIVLVGDEMQLCFRYTVRSSSGTTIFATPPRHRDTMFVMTLDDRRRVYALRTEGIATQPKETWIDAGRYVDYIVYFPPIDVSWSPIAFSEGNAIFRGATAKYWFWKRIDLVSTR